MSAPPPAAASAGERTSVYTGDQDGLGHVRKLVRCRERPLHATGDSSSDSGGEETYIKLAAIGEAAVGKTSLLKRFLYDTFDAKRVQTEGVDCRSLWLKSNHPSYDRRTHLTLVDTAGQERYQAVVPMMFTGAQGIFLVFDATNEHSYERVCEYWLNMVMQRNPTCVRMLVATKCDLYDALPSARRWMDALDMDEQARLLGCAGGYHAVSAKLGTHINAMVVQMVDMAIDQEQELMRANLAPAGGTINISARNNYTDNSKNCSC